MCFDSKMAMSLQNPAGWIALQFLTSNCSTKKPRIRQEEQEYGRIKPDVKLEKCLAAPVAEGIPHDTNGLLPCL